MSIQVGILRLINNEPACVLVFSTNSTIRSKTNQEYPRRRKEYPRVFVLKLVLYLVYSNKEGGRRRRNRRRRRGKREKKTTSSLTKQHNINKYLIYKKKKKEKVERINNTPIRTRRRSEKQ